MRLSNLDHEISFVNLVSLTIWFFRSSGIISLWLYIVYSIFRTFTVCYHLQYRGRQKLPSVISSWPVCVSLRESENESWICQKLCKGTRSCLLVGFDDRYLFGFSILVSFEACLFLVKKQYINHAGKLSFSIMGVVAFFGSAIWIFRGSCSRIVSWETYVFQLLWVFSLLV